MKELIIQDGIHFVDLQRLIFARRGQAGTVPGFVSLVASRLRAVRSFKARLANVPVSAAAARRDRERAGFLLPVRPGALSPFFGRIGRMVWKGEITVNRGDLLAVGFMAVLAVAFIAALLADVR